MQNLVSIVSQMGPNNPNRPMGFHMFQGYTPFYIMLGMFFVVIAFMLYYFPWLEKVKTSKDVILVDPASKINERTNIKNAIAFLFNVGRESALNQIIALTKLIWPRWFL